ncbi:MAG: hypothetical protein JXL80_04550 [Planctomycetes bacterium]|nr:hypothetical protein [Planctomycetota bacterium]
MKTRIAKAAMAAALVMGFVLLTAATAQAGHGSLSVRYTSARPVYVPTVQATPCYAPQTMYAAPVARSYPTRTLGFNHAYHRTWSTARTRTVVQPSRPVVVVIVVR